MTKFVGLLAVGRGLTGVPGAGKTALVLGAGVAV